MPTLVDAPRCESCGKVVGLKVQSDFTYRIARFVVTDDTFVDVPSARYTAVDEDDDTKVGPIGMRVCSIPCGKKVCRLDQFIVLIDEGDLVNPRAAYNAQGQQQKKFW